jgi:hypothetical protein
MGSLGSMVGYILEVRSSSLVHKLDLNHDKFCAQNENNGSTFPCPKLDNLAPRSDKLFNQPLSELVRPFKRL